VTKRKPCYTAPRTAACFVVVAAVSACGPPKVSTTKLEHEYGTGFSTLPTASASEIKANGVARTVGGISQGGLWQAALKVAMQRGPVIFADNNAKIIIAPPYRLLVEDTGVQQSVTCSFMGELYFDSAEPARELFVIKPAEKDNLVQEVLDRVVAQASVSQNLAPAGKWRYLAP
jgi:hypothetical protein